MATPDYNSARILEMALVGAVFTFYRIVKPEVDAAMGLDEQEKPGNNVSAKLKMKGAVRHSKLLITFSGIVFLVSIPTVLPIISNAVKLMNSKGFDSFAQYDFSQWTVFLIWLGVPTLTYFSSRTLIELRSKMKRLV